MIISRHKYFEIIEDIGVARRFEIVKWSVLGIPIFTDRILVSHKYLIVPEHIRMFVLKIDGYHCVYCDEYIRDNPTIDHLLPNIQGGSSMITNLVSSCRSCNSKKSGRIPEEACMDMIGGRFRLIRSNVFDPDWPFLFKEDIQRLYLSGVSIDTIYSICGISAQDPVPSDEYTKRDINLYIQDIPVA